MNLVRTAGRRAPSAWLLGAATAAALLACGAVAGGVPVVEASPAIDRFAATPASIDSGESSTLSWSVTGASSVSVEPDLGVVVGTTAQVAPAATTTYTLSATGPGGERTAQATVTVRAAPPTITGFVATPATIDPGGTTTLGWTVTGATSVSISPGPGVVTGTSVQVTPAATTTYTLTATGSGGTRTAALTVTVTAPAPTIASFAATPPSIDAGGSATLSWSVTGASSVSLSPGPGVVTGTSALVTPAATTPYTLTATGTGGTKTAQVTVTVAPASTAPPVGSFTAAPASVAAGGSATLSWSVTGATSVSISPGLGVVTGASAQVTPAATTTYTLTATGTGGTRTALATVTVVVPPPTIASFAATPASIDAGTSATLSWGVTGATGVSISPGPGVVTGTSAQVTPAATTTYTLTATGPGGTKTAQVTVTVAVPPPTVGVFAVSPASINAGGAATLSWSVSGATSVAISPGLGVVTGTSAQVTAAATTTYTLTATGVGGTQTATVTVTVVTSGGGTSVAAGNVSGHWTLAGSPYRVLGPVTVPHGAILTVDPGVKVEFQGRYKLSVYGGLQSVGTPSQHVVWTTTNADIARGSSWVGWRGISWAGVPFNLPATHDHGHHLFNMQYSEVGYVDKTDEPQADPWELDGCVYLIEAWVDDLVFDQNWLHHSRTFALRINHSENDPAAAGTPQLLSGNTFTDSVAGLSVAHTRSVVHFVGGGVANDSGVPTRLAATVCDSYDVPTYLDRFAITNCGDQALAPWYVTNVGGSVHRTGP